MFAALYMTLNSNTMFDLIKNPIVATKCTIVLISLMHYIFKMFTWTGKGGKLKTMNPWKYKSEALKSVGFIISTTILFHVIEVLFGAPFTEQTAETFHLALLLTATITVPVLIHLGTSSETLMRIYAFNSPELGTEMMMYITSICSLLGAWLGACVIPLDWDSPWQVWPVSCVLGTIAGHCVGLGVSAIHLSLQYWRINKIKLT